MSAKKKLHGLAFSVGDTPDEESIKRALEFVAPHVKWVRMYGLDCLPEYAHQVGLKTAVEAWLDVDPAINEDRLFAVIEAAKAGHVDIAVIGNEVQMRNDRSDKIWCTP